MIPPCSEIKSLELDVSEHVSFGGRADFLFWSIQRKRAGSSHGICSAPSPCMPFEDPQLVHSQHTQELARTLLMSCLSHRSCLFRDKQMILSIIGLQTLGLIRSMRERLGREGGLLSSSCSVLIQAKL